MSQTIGILRPEDEFLYYDDIGTQTSEYTVMSDKILIGKTVTNTQQEQPKQGNKVVVS